MTGKPRNGSSRPDQLLKGMGGLNKHVAGVARPLDSLRKETAQKFEETVRTLRQEMAQEFQGMRQETAKEFQRMRQETAQEFQDVRQEITQ